MAVGYDGSIRIDTRVDSKGFNVGVKSLIGALKPLMVAVGIAFGTAAIVNFGRSSVQAASQLASAMVGLESVVKGTGKSFSSAKDFINQYTKDGLVPATNAIAAYKNLALRGYSTEQIEKVMTALKDSAAFGRQASYTMGEAIQGASEGLKNENSILVDNAGVTKNVAKMWLDYAKAHGVAVTSLTQAQKIEAEVNGIMEETRFQTGDAAKATNTFAGQISALGVSFLNLKTAIGNAIIPVLTAIIPYIRAVIDWLTALFTQFAAFISVLFGVQVAAQDAGGAVGEMGEEAGQAGSEVGGAGKAAKGALAAFDELNVLAQDTGEGGGGKAPAPGGGGIPGIGDPEEEGGVLDAMAEKVAKFKERMLALLGPLIKAFDNLKAALIPLGETIWRGLKWAWDNILVPLGEWTITELLPSFLNLLAGAATLLNSALVALEPLWMWLWENVLKKIAEWTGGAIIDTLGWLTEALYKISDWINNNQTLFQTLIVFLGTLAIEFGILMLAIKLYSVVMTIATAVSGAFAAVMAFLTSPIGMVMLAIAALIAIVYLLIKYWPQISEAAQKACDWIKNTWKIVAAWFNDNIIVPLKNFFAPFWNWLKIVAYDIWLVIKYIWNVVAQWFQENVITPLQTAFDTAWKAIKGFFTGTWDDIKKIWKEVSTWFQTTVIDPVKKAFDILLHGEDGKGGLVGAFQKAWDTIKGAFKTALNGIIGVLNSFISFVFGAINDIIKGFNQKFAFLKGFITVPTITVPQIPLLATGAVIPPNAAFLAMLGDQRAGKNIEAPEGLLRQIIREEMTPTGGDIRIGFKGNLGELIRVLKPEIDRENTRIGRSMVSVK